MVSFNHENFKIKLKFKTLEKGLSKMTSKLALMKQKLREQQEQTSGGNTKSFGPKKLFPHWNDDIIPIGEQARVRFLPDQDQDNTFFWKEKREINLPFPGIKGGEMREFVLKVPCMETWGENCPILAEVRPWWKGDQEDKDLASKYWKKYSYILQGLVCETPAEEEEKPENPIRIFKVNKKIFETIRGALMDDDFEESPDDYQGGTDFVIKKSKQGTFKSYDSSSWSRRSRSLSTEELQDVEKHGLFNLADELGKKPDADELKAIMELFEASLNGDLYDPERFSWMSWRPYGVEQGTKTAGNDIQNIPTNSTPQQTPAEDANDAPWQEPKSETPAADTTSAGENADVAAILAKIRSQA